MGLPEPFSLPRSDDPTKVATDFSLLLHSPIPPPGYFNSCIKKLSRAGFHINELENSINEYVASSPIIIGHEIREPSSNNSGGPHITFEKNVYPPEFGLIVGDIVHNLRASLDALAGDLAIRSNKSSKGVYFPIAYSEIDLPNQIKDKHFNRTGKDCERLLRELRPWQGGNDALRGLHELDIIDKHSTIAPINMNALSPLLSLTGVEGLSGSGIVLNKIIFTFAEGGPFEKRDVVLTLHHLAQTVKEIIEAFIHLIEKRTLISI